MMFTQDRWLEYHSKDRVNRLLQEAEQMRLIRRCKLAHRPLFGSLLFHTGGWLMRCGDWLQRRYTAPAPVQPKLG